MSLCDTCKVEESIRKSREPACCAWYLENVVIAGSSVDRCSKYEPIDTLKKVYNKLCPTLTGYILRWINSELFIARITNRFGTTGEMICNKKHWEVCNNV